MKSPSERLMPVTVRDSRVVFPTYLPDVPDRNPMFLEKRVYQGSSGRVYPLPFIDRIAEKPSPRAWRAITLENEYIEIMILPEIGGRIHRLRDKTNGYDAIYYQPVIKPALVGLAGPWISGGIEFNWPQHHRPSTFMPSDVSIERHPNGAVTVWLSEHDPMARMKGMHGIHLEPDCAVLELRVRAYNRTDDVQTFLWWANAATAVHERYQSFFPSDVTFVADHAKRAMSTFPCCTGRYYGVDYAARAARGVPARERPDRFVPDGSYPPNDLSWYANIPVPTSYMCMGSKQGFFGGYDHRAHAGIVHVANPHIAPGKKQWTWGNHAFGHAWDRLLTDPDDEGVCRPYIELMAGVYTDNQPDFSFLAPGETKTWRQYWYPLRGIGPADHANTELAVRLRVEGRTVRIGVHATRAFPDARIALMRARDGRTLCRFTRALSPSTPLVVERTLRAAVRRWDLVLIVTTAEGRPALRYQPEKPLPPPRKEELSANAATEPPPPEQVASVDELFVTGLHLEQYRHATRAPEAYWREGLRRDPGDARCNLAMGRWHLRRGEWSAAERHLRASVARQTLRNPNPADGEAHYHLGRVLRFLGRFDEAYAALYKSTWNQAWVSAGTHALAEIDCARGDWHAAEDHLQRALSANADNLRALALLAEVRRRTGGDAMTLIREGLRRDPLDAWLNWRAGRPIPGGNGVRLDLAFDLARAGLQRDALEVLDGADRAAGDGTVPMIAYARAWLLENVGDLRAARAARRAAQRASPDYCFPSRLEEYLVLEAAVAADPGDPRANLFLGHWLYDRRRHREAVACWRRTVRREPRNAVAWRCLGIAMFNVLGEPERARAAFVRARAAAPDDARLLYEADQLARRLGEAPARRLGTLQRQIDLVSRRDDLTVELCALYNQTGRPADALRVLSERRFQPWEGGEGQALGQYVRTRLLLGREALSRRDYETAQAHFERALIAPENLGEARHLLANASDVHFWIGEARAARGDRVGARRAWRASAEFKGDFQTMRVRPFSEMTFYSAMALRRLGRRASANALLRALLAYARRLERQPATIDYFATSLPTMLLFDEDIGARQITTARFLRAQALFGLGRVREARRLLKNVLSRDPHHAAAADMKQFIDAE